MSLDLAEDSVLDVLKKYESKGYTGQFSSRSGGLVHCHTCNEEEPAAQTPLEAMHRFEGSSNPEDESVLLALECVACGAWGTANFTYGTDGTAEDALVLQELMDARDLSPMPAGT